MSDFHPLRNILSNQVRFVLTGLIGFVLTPILFHSLQPENYAILVFTLSTVGVLECLDLGLFSTLIRSTGALVAQGKHLELKRLASSTFWLLAGLGTASALALWLLSPFLTRFFRVADAGIASGQLALTLVGVSLAFQLPATALRGYLDGCQDFLRANVVDVVTHVLRAAFIIVLLWKGHGLLAVATAFPIAALLRLSGMLFLARRTAIPFCPRWAEANFQSLEKVSQFASLTFLIQITYWCFSQLDIFLAARILSLPSLAILAISRRFPTALVEIGYLALVVTYPLLTSAAARNDRQTMQKFLFLATRNLLAFAIPLAAALYVWTDVVLLYWIGPEALAGVPVFRAFLFFAIFAGLRGVPANFLYGVGKIRFHAVLSVIVLGLGLGVGAQACMRGGLVGLAVVFVIIQAVETSLLYRQALQLASVDFRLWVQKAVLPVLWAMLPAGVWLGISYQVLPHNLSSLAASVVPGLLLFGVVFTRLVAGPGKQPLRVYARKLLTEID